MKMPTLDDLLGEGEKDLAEFVDPQDLIDDGPLPLVSTKFPKVVCVAGCPKAEGEAKIEKLTAFIKLKLGNWLKSLGEYTVQFVHENDAFTGCLLIMFESPKFALDGCVRLEGQPVDKAHPIRAVMLDDLEKYTKFTPDDVEAAPEQTISRSNFRWWRFDERCRAQFVIRAGNATEIYWHDPHERAPVLCYNGNYQEEGRVWTSGKVQWSPRGSYLATFHPKGIALWAGPHFCRQAKFEHDDVQHLEFSPDEQFAITWDGQMDPNNELSYRVWTTHTGGLLRTFGTPTASPRGPNADRRSGGFPHLLWSHDAKYLARSTDKEIFVYVTPSMSQLTEVLTPDSDPVPSPLHFSEGLERFEWSPCDNIMSVWSPEVENHPAHLMLIEIPSRKELAIKTVFNIKDASIHWQSEGDYLCMKGTRLSKSGKSGHPLLEIFRMREKNIPVDHVEIEEKFIIKLFEWENTANRFAVLLENEATHTQVLRVFQVNAVVELVATFPTSHINSLIWAPTGNYFVMVNMAGEGAGSMSSEGELLFASINAENKLDILSKSDHFMINYLAWEPSGRYVITAVNVPLASDSYRGQMEAGYTIWTFQGRLVHKSQKESFYQVLWRPQPPCLLPPELADEVKKNLAKHSKRYDHEDESLKDKQRKAIEEEKRRLLEEFMSTINGIEKEKREHPRFKEWEKCMRQFEARIPYEEKQEVHQEILETKTEVMVI